MRRQWPRHGDLRLRKRFLWLPKLLLNARTRKMEQRWLEVASWEQLYYSIATGCGWADWRWYDGEVSDAEGQESEDEI